MATQLQRSDSIDKIVELLGPNADDLLKHTSQTISKNDLNLPGPDFIDRVWSISDRSPAVLARRPLAAGVPRCLLGVAPAPARRARRHAGDARVAARGRVA